VSEEIRPPEWLELSVQVDHEAVEPVTELFARYGYNEGVVIEEPFTQEPDGDNLAVDQTRPVMVRTFVSAADVPESTVDEIRHALWHLGQMRAVGDLTLESRREEDWANAWKEHYRPIRVGRKVVVRPPWQEYQAEGDDIVVELDPGMAFGTGTHPSTRSCLLGLEDEIKPGDRVLDIGTGSGILAIAAAKLGASQIDAVDIEPIAVRSTRENAVRNGVGAVIRVAEGSAGRSQPYTGTYDLVLANIIARVLIDIADGVASSVNEGGTLILAGIIESREPAVREAYDRLGLSYVRRAQIEDWVSLIYRRPKPS
jgi:ribosomal protein L11 methyltransferase